MITMTDAEFVARAGHARVELHHHPKLWPETPWSVEPFVERGGKFHHWSGRQFAERPSPEEFVQVALAQLEALGRAGVLLP